MVVEGFEQYCYDKTLFAFQKFESYNQAELFLFKTFIDEYFTIKIDSYYEYEPYSQSCFKTLF